MCRTKRRSTCTAWAARRGRVRGGLRSRCCHPTNGCSWGTSKSSWARRSREKSSPGSSPRSSHCSPSRSRRSSPSVVHRELHRFVDDPRVEIHVGVQLPRDEVVLLERDALQLEGDVDERILPRDVEHFLGDALDDLGARVVVLVNPMPEAEQTKLAA